MDINYWFKENFPKCVIKRKSLKNIVNMIRHEIIHYKIFKKFVKEDLDAHFEIYLTREDSYQFSYSAKCLTIYPLVYNSLRYYPKWVFIEFVQYLFDIIWSIFTLKIFKNFIPYTTYFLKVLFEFKTKGKPVEVINEFKKE